MVGPKRDPIDFDAVLKEIETRSEGAYRDGPLEEFDDRQFDEFVGGKIREFRKEAGLTARMAAEIVGLTDPSAFTRYETGGRHAKLGVIWRLAKHFGRPVEDFLPGSADSKSGRLDGVGSTGGSQVAPLVDKGDESSTSASRETSSSPSPAGQAASEEVALPRLLVSGMFLQLAEQIESLPARLGPEYRNLKNMEITLRLLASALR